jgi:hypothetical protein
MDTVTYPEPRVAAFIAGHFIPARLRVKESPELVQEYLVAWTPNIVISDNLGKIHYRLEGYSNPEDFLAYLSLGVGKYRLNGKRFEQAGERFAEVARRHAGTDAGAEALYWLGVARYKQSHDSAQLRPSWQRLAQEYPNSEWTKRTQIPAKS